MTVYLSSPGNQMQADRLNGMPVLLSFACWSRWLDDYSASFGRVLIDSGAYSELSSGKVIDGHKYRDWYQQREHFADAIAGLDDIRGDWRRSLRNYELFGGFPVYHDSDPPELLDDLIPLARERGGWLGVGLLPPRHGKESWVRETCERIPPDLHVHGFALRLYSDVPRLDSFDSTNWLLDSQKLARDLPWLTPAECVGLIVKRYQREKRVVRQAETGLFAGIPR